MDALPAGQLGRCLYAVVVACLFTVLGTVVAAFAVVVVVLSHEDGAPVVAVVTWLFLACNIFAGTARVLVCFLCAEQPRKGTKHHKNKIHPDRQTIQRNWEDKMPE